MTNNDWQNMGNDIRNMVQNAIDSQNFRELNRNINQAVNSAMNGLNEGVRRANENLQQAAERNMSRRQANNWTAGRRETSYQYTHEKEPAQNPWKWSAGQTRANQVRRPGYQPPNPLYGSTNGLMGGGTALAVLGWISASGLGIATLVLSILNFVVGTVGIGIGLGIVAPLFVGSGVMAWGGMKMLSRAKRFRSYVAKLGQRTYCDIKELALAVGKSERFVQKDVAKMIQKRMFRQGHLDRQGKCLMTSNETYQLYLNTMQQIEQKKKKQRR